MKGRIVEIKRFAVHDGDGIRTTVFLKGCPLKCRWCHNPESISFAHQLAYYEHLCESCGACAAICPAGAQQMKDGIHHFQRDLCVGCGKCESACPKSALKLYGKDMTADELLPLLLEDKEFYETSGGGVTLSGGECLLQAEFCREVLEKLKAQQIHTAVDTCGYVSQKAIDCVEPYTDIFLYDLKAFDEEVHQNCTGKSNADILENLRYLRGKGKKVEIRIPYVPDMNDSQIEKIAEFLKGFENITKVKVLPYHNYAGSKYEALGMENTMPETLPTEEEIHAARECLKRWGLPV